MLKRCLSPLTLVNQVALIVLLSTAIGLAGMAVSGWWCKAFRAAPMPLSTKRDRLRTAKLPSVGSSAIKRERQALN